MKMIQTAKEKTDAALNEVTRVLNLILNQHGVDLSHDLYQRAKRAYDQATAALRDEKRDEAIRAISQETKTGA